jgi:hypothetical protein
MAKDRTKVFNLSHGALTIGAVDLGYVENGELALEFDYVEATVGQYGNSPIDIFHTATRASFKVTLDQFELSTLQKVMQGSVLITSGANQALGLGSSSGARQTAQELTFTPSNSEVSTLGLLTLWRVVPTAVSPVKYENGVQKTEVTFTALINESKSEGEKLGRIGNSSVTQETVAPTISSSSPADDATGVATNATPTITFSEAMDADTLTTKNVFLFADAGETGVQTPVSISLSYAVGTYILTITPAAALSAATKYEIILSDWIKDAAGNRFAGAKRSFTTA